MGATFALFKHSSDEPSSWLKHSSDDWPGLLPLRLLSNIVWMDIDGTICLVASRNPDGCNVPQRLRIQSSWGLRHTSLDCGRNWVLAAIFQHPISGWFSSGHSGFHPPFFAKKDFKREKKRKEKENSLLKKKKKKKKKK